MTPSAPTVHYVLDTEDGPVTFSRKWAWLEPYDDRGNYILVEDFWVSWTVGPRTFRIRVPAGLITDIASIPRWVWSLFRMLPDGLYRNAALIHDAGYMWQGVFPEGWFQELVNGQWVDVVAKWAKNEIDRLFLRIMKACDVPHWKRNTMYYAVKVGGLPAWWRTDQTRERWRYAFASSVLQPPAVLSDEQRIGIIHSLTNTGE